MSVPNPVAVKQTCGRDECVGRIAYYWMSDIQAGRYTKHTDKCPCGGAGVTGTTP